MKKILSAALVLALLMSLFSGCSSNKNIYANENYKFDDDTLLSGKHYVRVSLEKYGAFIIEVDADSAPKTATHFLKAVNSGAYNGTYITSAMKDAVIGGGYNEEYSDTVDGEFSLNGYENPIKGEKGVIYLIHNADYNSASTEFFILLGDDGTDYDGKYAAFGRVVDGLSVLTDFAASDICNSSYGTIPSSFQPVIEYMQILDDFTPAA